ncbi:hypothetical protein ACFWNG_26035 [Streptomyces sp. NPDC058391]|uniref:hypothetical protein n=1 Tax=Streptomyces sp. NPDC058391 TaxID=3346476 RepID=UPI003648C741
MNPTPKTQTPDPDTAEALTPEVTLTKAESKDESRAGSAEERDAVPAAGEDTAVADELDGQDDDLDDDLADDDLDDLLARHPSGLGAAATAIVSVCLGIVALTGTWTGRVVAERETLVGQITSGQSPTPAQQISEMYGDAWHATAAVNGVVALLALLIGAIVLALPQRASWVRPVAVAGAVLGFLGLLVSIGMYFDLFVALPSVAA